MAVAAWGEVGQWSTALHAFIGTGRGVSPSIISATSFVDACKAGQEWRRCLDFVAFARTQVDLALNIFLANILVTALGTVSRWISALSCASSFGRGLRRDIISQNAQLSALEVAGRWESAVALSMETRHSGFSPSLIGENSAVKACAHEHRWWTASSLLQRFDSLRLRPDLVSCSSATHVCGSSFEWARALCLMTSTVEAQLKLDSILLRTVVSACEGSIQGTQWARAASLFHSMRPLMLQQEAVAFNSVLSASEKGRRWQHGLGLWMSLGAVAVSGGQLALKAIAASTDPSEWQRVLILCPPQTSDAVTCEAVITTCESAAAAAALPPLLSAIAIRGLSA
ncbi:unnamed protein product, partial [Symbiodinium microadriaticum]